MEGLETRLLLSSGPNVIDVAPAAAPGAVLAAPLSPANGTGQIAGTQWHDLNGDGTRTPDEPALAGWQIFLDNNGNLFRDEATLDAASSDVPVTLVDLSTVSSSLVTSGHAGQLIDVNVSLDITHGLTAEVDAFLISPSGTQVELFTDVGSSGVNFVNTTLDDQAAMTIDQRRAPFTGRLRPEGVLANLNGEDPNGTWTLEIFDDRAGTIGHGTLDGWSLQLTVASEPTAQTNANGQYVLTGVAQGQHRVRQLGQAGFKPTFPTTGVHLVDVSENHIVSDIDFGNRLVTAEIRGTKFNDFDGNGQQDPAEGHLQGWTIFLDENRDGLLQTDIRTIPALELPLKIPDRTEAISRPALSHLTIADTGSTLLDLDVALNISHPFTQDLRVELISPAGTVQELFLNMGGLTVNQANFERTVLDDEAAMSILDGAAPFSGSFQPENPLTVFDGEDPNGVWTLVVLDETSTNAGELDNWSLTPTTAVEPATLTDADGSYAFIGLQAGDYVIAEVGREHFTRTFPLDPASHRVTVGQGQIATDLDFGGRGALSVVEGITFEDDNGNGTFEEVLGEQGLDGWTIELVDRRTGNVLTKTTTFTEVVDSENELGQTQTQLIPGRYRFDAVPLGDYDVREAVQPGWVVTEPLLSFGEPRFTSGIASNFVTTVDVDGDGASDAIVTNRESDSISVHLNLGDGTLGPATTFGVGTQPNAVSAGDFDADGDQDLAVTNGGGTDVTILANDGLGNFKLVQAVEVGSTSTSNVSADINGDGILDLAVLNVLDSTISVLSGRGDGTFGPRIVSAAGPFSRGLRLADIDGDGRTDAVMTGFMTPDITILLGLGDGTFGEGTTVHADARLNDDVVPDTRFVSLADLNGDELLDLVTVTQQATKLGNVASLVTIFNDGDLGFQEPQPQIIDNFRNGDLFIKAADLTGNGVVDLIVSDFTRDTISTYQNRGDGTFDLSTQIHSGDGPVRLAVDDLDGNGRADILALNSNDESVSVLLGRPGEHRLQLAEPSLKPISDLNFGNFQAVTIEGRQILDRNGDGIRQRGDFTVPGWPIRLLDRRLEPIAETVTDSTGMYAFANLGPGVFVVEDVARSHFKQTAPLATSFAPPLRFVSATAPSAIVVADVDSDGDGDLVMTSPTANVVSLLTNKGNGRMRVPQDLTAGDRPIAVVAEDLNGDKMPDLAVANAGSNDVSILFNQGDGTYSTAGRAPLEVGIFPAAIVAGDFDGDDRPDLAVANFDTTSDAGSVSILINSGAGKFHDGPVINVGRGPTGLAAADLDGDNDLDLAVANFQGQSLSVVFNQTDDGQLGFATPIELPVSSSPLTVASGDLNGDDLMDLAVVSPDSTTVKLLMNVGEGLFKWALPVETGVVPSSVVVNDLNGDGLMDLTTADQFNGRIGVLLGLAGGGFTAPANLATTGRPVAITSADLNGNGDLDLAVADRASGAALVLLSSKGQHVVRTTSGDPDQLLQDRDFGNTTDQADLLALLTSSLPTEPVVPGDRIRYSVTAFNGGNRDASGPLTINLYASADTTLDKDDLRLVGLTETVNIAPGQKRTLRQRLDITGALEPGRYFLIAELVTTLPLAELDQTNNVAVSDQPIEVAWMFGQVGQRHRVRLRLTEVLGPQTKVTFALRGQGFGQVTRNGDEFDVIFENTTESARTRIRTKGEGTASVRHVSGIAPLRQIIAPKLDITGDLKLDSVDRLRFADVGPGVWKVTNKVHRIRVNSTAAGWSADLPGGLNRFVARGHVSGDLAARFLNVANIGGDLVDARILTGTDFRSDGRLGGTDDAADRHTAAQMRSLQVRGQVIRSVVAAGLDPVDGLFNNANDIIVGGIHSTIRSIRIRGSADDESFFAAGTLPDTVRINGARMSPMDDDRFFS